MKLRAILAALVAVAIAASFALAPAAPAAAEVGDATISGKVTDTTTGAALDAVCVVVGPAASVCYTITNAIGEYRIILSGLPAAGFATPIQFFRTGYASATYDVTVLPGQNLTLNATMTSNTPGQPAPSATPPPFIANPPPALPTFTVYLPNITRMLGGRYGWHTPFIVQNVGAVNTTLSVKYYNFTDGSLVATRTATVAPGRSYVGSPNDDVDPILPENAQFSVVVTSTGSPVVAVVNEHQGGSGITPEALSYSGFSTGSTKVSLPLVSKLSGGWLTTMIIQNLGANPTTVTGTFTRLDAAGTATITATITRTVLPGRSQFIDPRSEATLVSGAEYAGTFTSAEPVAVVANAHNDLPGSVAPMGDSYNGVPTVTGTVSYSPYVPKNADGIGRSSRLVIQNAGTTDATPSLSLRLFGAATDATTVSGPVLAPGTSWSYVPVVADGEYSAIVAGGAFAIVTTAISPATAMFYTGTSTPATKLYMPNVTRSLSGGAGDPGWTTPILIQSADATAATLSWYRFSDGSLVTTQSVVLVAGATTRVNPTTVTGLANNTQYAVVLTSPGTVVAIVTELNLSAGDNAMIYKSFLQP